MLIKASYIKLSDTPISQTTVEIKQWIALIKLKN